MPRGRPKRTHCKTCGVELTSFNSVSNAQTIRPDCKECYNKAKNELRNLDREKFSQYNWEYMLKRNFNITPEEYNAILESQGCKCAVCFGDCIRYDKLSVDHDHTTNKVRGLLCHRCNTVLGMVNDDELLLFDMMDYLKRHARKSA